MWLTQRFAGHTTNIKVGGEHKPDGTKLTEGDMELRHEKSEERVGKSWNRIKKKFRGISYIDYSVGRTRRQPETDPLSKHQYLQNTGEQNTDTKSDEKQCGRCARRHRITCGLFLLRHFESVSRLI